MPKVPGRALSPESPGLEIPQDELEGVAEDQVDLNQNPFSYFLKVVLIQILIQKPYNLPRFFVGYEC